LKCSQITKAGKFEKLLKQKKKQTKSTRTEKDEKYNTAHLKDTLEEWTGLIEDQEDEELA